MNIEVRVENGHLRIVLDGILHFSLKLLGVFAVESYDVEGKYFIKYYTSEGNIETWYLNRGVWEEILRQLKKETEI